MIRRKRVVDHNQRQGQPKEVVADREPIRAELRLGQISVQNISDADGLLHVWGSGANMTALFIGYRDLSGIFFRRKPLIKSFNYGNT